MMPQPTANTAKPRAAVRTPPTNWTTAGVVMRSWPAKTALKAPAMAAGNSPAASSTTVMRMARSTVEHGDKRRSRRTGGSEDQAQADRRRGALGCSRAVTGHLAREEGAQAEVGDDGGELPDVLRDIVRPDTDGAEHPCSVYGQQQTQSALDHGRRQRSGRVARYPTRQAGVVRASAVRARRVVVRVTHGTWLARSASRMSIRFCIPLLVPTWRVTLDVHWIVPMKLVAGYRTDDHGAA